MPYDILEQALKLTNVGYLNATAEIYGKDLCKHDKEYAVKQRLDPVKYLSKLVSDPKALLKYMRENKIVLSGSRAAAYFSPSLCEPDSDWDFYIVDDDAVPYPVSNRAKFISFLGSLGAIIVEENMDSSYEQSLNNILTVSTMEITRKRTHKIQIISHTELTNMQAVLSFDISAVQCVITGYCAISAYHLLTKDNNSLWWKSKRMLELKRDLEFEMMGHDNQEECNAYSQLNTLNNRLIKYINRGINILPNSDKSITRSLRDSQSLVIIFEDTKNSTEHILDYCARMKWKQTYQLCTRFLTDTFVNKLSESDVAMFSVLTLEEYKKYPF